MCSFPHRTAHYALISRRSRQLVADGPHPQKFELPPATAQYGAHGASLRKGAARRDRQPNRRAFTSRPRCRAFQCRFDGRMLSFSMGRSLCPPRRRLRPTSQSWPTTFGALARLPLDEITQRRLEPDRQAFGAMFAHIARIPPMRSAAQRTASEMMLKFRVKRRVR